MSSPLSQQVIQAKWGGFHLKDLFEIKSSIKRFDANKVTVLERGLHPYIIRSGSNNGQRGYLKENEQFLNEGNTISFGQDTATLFYQNKPYFTGDKIKILKSTLQHFGQKEALFFITSLNKAFSNFSWGGSRFNVKTIGNQIFNLPIQENNQIDLNFINSFISELEREFFIGLDQYLSRNGLKNYWLTAEEKNALNNLGNIKYKSYNLKSLFDKSTRGKRLKSEDRVPGNLPFVTAGEADEGVSDFIGNKVTVFAKNTATIDMFGSAKYRSYEYGADDHVAVVHTEKLKENAAIFVTSAIHKSSHNGQFDYGRNFYAKDADALNILLPEKDGRPDYELMELVISAVKKLIVKAVVDFTNNRLESYHTLQN